MKRFCLFLFVMCTSQVFCADIERHWKGGCSPDNWPVQSAGIDITVNYYSVTAGILHIRRTGGGEIITPQSVSAGSGSFTITHFTRSGYAGQDNDTTAVEWDGVAVTAFVEGGPTLPVSGGQEITQHTHGPSADCYGTAGETTTEVNVAITYTVNGTATPTPSPSPSGTPPARCQWQLTGTLHAQCETGTVASHTISLWKNGALVGEQVIPPGYTGGTIDFDGTDDSGTTIQLRVDGASGEVHTVQCHGDPPPGNWWFADILLPGACNQSPTPAPSPTPGASPHPSLTPGPTKPPFTPPPGGSPGPSPGPPTGSPSSTVAVANFNDFYEPIRKAVRDSGNDTAVTIPGKAPLPGIELDDSKMGEITDAVTASKDQATSLSDRVSETTSKAGEKLAAVSTTGIGSDCLISIHTTGWIHDRLQIDTFDIDFCKFSTGIALFRTFIAWSMGFCFFVLTLRTLVYDN